MRSPGTRPTEATPTPTKRPSSSSPSDVEAGHICPLRSHLDQSIPKEGLVKGHGIGDMRRLGKLNVRIALGLAAPAVTEDGDTVDGAAGLEVGL